MLQLRAPGVDVEAGIAHLGVRGALHNAREADPPLGAAVPCGCSVIPPSSALPHLLLRRRRHSDAVADPALIEVVDRALRNYLAGAAPDPKADLAADAEVTLPTRRLHLLEVEQVVWLGAPGSGAVLSTLTATDSGGTVYTLTDELGIAYRERPYVDFIEVVPTGN